MTGNDIATYIGNGALVVAALYAALTYHRPPGATAEMSRGSGAWKRFLLRWAPPFIACVAVGFGYYDRHSNDQNTRIAEAHLAYPLLSPQATTYRDSVAELEAINSTIDILNNQFVVTLNDIKNYRNDVISNIDHLNILKLSQESVLPANEWEQTIKDLYNLKIVDISSLEWITISIANLDTTMAAVAESNNLSGHEVIGDSIDNLTKRINEAEEWRGIALRVLQKRQMELAQ